MEVLRKCNGGIPILSTSIFNVDARIQQYRQTFSNNEKVNQLYKVQFGWYQEATYCQALTGDTSPPPILYVSDIYLHWSSDSDTMRLTKEVMYGNLENIVSVELIYINQPLLKIVQHLQQCSHLSTLCISDMRYKEDNDQLLSVIPHLTQLDKIVYYGAATAVDTDENMEDILPVYDAADVNAVNAILQLTQVKRMLLWFVDMGDEGVAMTRDMRRLQELWLYNVFMSARSWDSFVSSLRILQQAVYVKLYKTNISAATVSRILTSPHFEVIVDEEKRDEKGRYVFLDFTTVPPKIDEQDDDDAKEEGENEEGKHKEEKQQQEEVEK